MSYALVIDGQLVEVRNPRKTEQKLTDGAWIGPADGRWDDALAEACGFVKVQTTPRPDDTATHTYDRSVVMVGTTPTETWTQRPKTQAELDGEQAESTRTRLETLARDAIQANRDFINDDITSLTNLQRILRMERYLKAVARQNNAIIRMLVATDTLTDPTVDEGSEGLFVQQR